MDFDHGFSSGFSPPDIFPPFSVFGHAHKVAKSVTKSVSRHRKTQDKKSATKSVAKSVPLGRKIHPKIRPSHQNPLQFHSAETCALYYEARNDYTKNRKLFFCAKDVCVTGKLIPRELLCVNWRSQKYHFEAPELHKRIPASKPCVTDVLCNWEMIGSHSGTLALETEDFSQKIGRFSKTRKWIH